MIGIAVRGDGPIDEFTRALDSLRSDQEANHNYSVWFSANPRVFHRLQWGGCTVVRTRDGSRFGWALALHLSGHGAPSGGVVRADGVVAVHAGRATVLPVSLRQHIPAYERPLREAGAILHDAPWVDVDLHSGEVVLAPPRLAAGRFDGVVDRLPRTSRPDPLPHPGRYPLAGWYFASVVPGEHEMAAVDAVATVLTGLRWPLTEPDQPAAVAAIFERIPFGCMPLRTPGDLLERMRT